jgi:hypothetical protein
VHQQVLFHPELVARASSVAPRLRSVSGGRAGGSPSRPRRATPPA